MSDDEVPARERWNARYGAPGFQAFPDAPAEWLVEHRALLEDLRTEDRTARALDVACGDGRNARWLAELGFAVDAVDVSDVAIGALRLAADARDLSVEARVFDATQDALPVGEYDVVVVMHFLHRDVFGSLQAALRPGGVLLYETFTRDHVDVLGSLLHPAYLLEPNELLHAFAGLFVRHYREGIVERGDHRSALASLVAQRSADG